MESNLEKFKYIGVISSARDVMEVEATYRLNELAIMLRDSESLWRNGFPLRVCRSTDPEEHNNLVRVL